MKLTFSHGCYEGRAYEFEELQRVLARAAGIDINQMEGVADAARLPISGEWVAKLKPGGQIREVEAPMKWAGVHDPLKVLLTLRWEGVVIPMPACETLSHRLMDLAHLMEQKLVSTPTIGLNRYVEMAQQFAAGLMAAAAQNEDVTATLTSEIL